MKRLLILATLATLSGVSCLSLGQTEGPRQAGQVPSRAQSIVAVQIARDVSAARTAYTAAADRNDLQLNQAYVAKMIELAAPEEAYEQARLVEKLSPDNGLAMAVVSFVQARNGNMPEALAEIVLAAQSSPEEPFVRQLAGQLCAWVDWNSDRVKLEDYIADSLARMRQRLAGRSDFDGAYADAMAAYQELAAAESSAIAQGGQDETAVPALPPVQEDEGYADADDETGRPGAVDEDAAGDMTVFAEPTVGSPPPVINVYNSYVPAAYSPPAGPWDDFSYHPELVIFIGRIHRPGLVIGRSCGRDVVVEHARNIYIGKAADIFVNNVTNVVIDKAHKVVPDQAGRLVASPQPRRLELDEKGQAIASRPRRAAADSTRANTGADHPVAGATHDAAPARPLAAATVQGDAPRGKSQPAAPKTPFPAAARQETAAPVRTAPAVVAGRVEPSPAISHGASPEGKRQIPAADRSAKQTIAQAVSAAPVKTDAVGGKETSIKATAPARQAVTGVPRALAARAETPPPKADIARKPLPTGREQLSPPVAAPAQEPKKTGRNDTSAKTDRSSRPQGMIGRNGADALLTQALPSRQASLDRTETPPVQTPIRAAATPRPPPPIVPADRPATPVETSRDRRPADPSPPRLPDRNDRSAGVPARPAPMVTAKHNETPTSPLAPTSRTDRKAQP